MGAWDGEAASLVIKCAAVFKGLGVQLRTGPLTGQSFSMSLEDNPIVNCVISLIGQLLCHPVHGSSQGEGGSCPTSGEDSQREPRGDSGELAVPAVLFSEDWGLELRSEGKAFL